MKKYLLTLIIAAAVLLAAQKSQKARPGEEEPSLNATSYNNTGGKAITGVYTKFGTGLFPPGSGGSVNSGTAGQIAYYATSGIAVSGDANLTDNGSSISAYGSTVCTPGNGACGGAPTATFMIGAGEFTTAGMQVLSSSSQVTDVALRVYVERFNTPFKLSFTSINFIATNNVLGGSDVAFGLYSTAGNLLYTSPTQHVTNSSNTKYTITTSITEPPGTYFLAVTAADAGHTTSQSFGASTFISPDALTYNSIVMWGYSPNSATQAGGIGTTITLPSTLGTLTAATNSSVGMMAPVFQP